MNHEAIGTSIGGNHASHRIGFRNNDAQSLSMATICRKLTFAAIRSAQNAKKLRAGK